MLITNSAAGQRDKKEFNFQKIVQPWNYTTYNLVRYA